MKYRTTYMDSMIVDMNAADRAAESLRGCLNSLTRTSLNEYECLECTRAGTVEREVEGLIVHLCAVHAAEFDMPASDEEGIR